MGMVHGVNGGSTVWEVPSARSAHAREARFFFELIINFGTSNPNVIQLGRGFFEIQITI